MQPALASPDAFEEAAAWLADHDEVLAEVIANAGLPTFTPHKNYYQELVESIVSQQLSVKAAASIMKKFLALFDGEFPPPERILEKSVDELRTAGLSRPKIGYIQDLASKVLTDAVRFNHLDALSNDEVIRELTAIKGVGVWTVHMFLIFCMGRLDVLPWGDLGIRNGIKKLYNLDAVPDQKTIEEIAIQHTWHPYESVAAWYVWHSLDNKPAL